MRLLFQFLIYITCASAIAQNYAVSYLHQWNNLLIELMVEDGFNPVLATRALVYPNIAAYETVAYFDSALVPLKGKLNNYEPKKLGVNKSTIALEVALVEATSMVVKEVVYRIQDCEKLYNSQMEVFTAKYDQERIENSKLLGKTIADNVINYMKKDGYNETKAMPNYVYLKQPFAWQPTPPEFRNALEPNWKSIRPMIIKNIISYDVSLAFIPDSNKKSKLYKYAIEVYKISKNLTDEEKMIAEFWDDNPDLNNQFSGHAGMPRRHINPASHWMSIAMQSAKFHNLTLTKNVQLFTLLSIAEFDTKIVVWQTKYTTNLIRPITYINQFIDKNWNSLLVTPPFPEHSSGHSACSRASAEILSNIIGNKTAFTDSTMNNYLGLPVRNFKSYYQAAKEVSESRIFGGIHYRSGIEAGEAQGKKIGQLVCKELLRD